MVENFYHNVRGPQRIYQSREKSSLAILSTPERSLILIKPDAVENGHVATIRKSLEAENLTVIQIGYVVLNLTQVKDFYKWDQIDHPAAIESYICNHPILVWIIEGIDALAKTREVKQAVRKRFQRGRLKNLFHTSDSLVEFNWQYGLLTQQKLIMTEAKTNNQVQVIVYRCTDSGETQFLMLKRNERKGGFWQSITGNVHVGESFEAAAMRELHEEIGVSDATLIDVEYSFEFSEGGKTMFERVFGAMIGEDQSIQLSNEHTDSRWTSVDEAINAYLKYPGNKEGVRRLYARIQPSASQEGMRK